MKRVILFLLLVLISLGTSVFPQNEEMNCVTNFTETNWNGQIGGRYLPSEGTIKVLIIFAQFPDDNHDVNNISWRKDQAPTDMNNWVDETWSANATTGYLTDYFNDMSFNKLKFIGKEVYKKTLHTRQWYLDNQKQRGYIHKELIQNLDLTWDFAQFDNWDYNGEYNFVNTPDGAVDFIIIIWRNICNEYSNPRELWPALDMGRWGNIGGTDFTVDNGQRVIKTGFQGGTTSPTGGGVTLVDWFNEDMFRFSIHEFGHYLLGGNSQHVGHGFWGLCSGWGVKSYVANSFERYRLGWINLNTIQNSPDQTITNATLPDYITTGVAYRLVVDAATNQYFYIENHQKQSIWETSRAYQEATIENGIYVLRQDALGGENTFIKCLAADGRYNWTVNQRIQSPWDPTQMLPVFKMLNPDRVNGYTDLEWIPWTWNGIPQTPASIHFIEDPVTGQPVLDVEHWGEGTDAFRMDYNQMFSPYSNPNSQRLNKTTTPFGFNINGFNEQGVASLDLYVGTSLNGPPSKPQNLKINHSTNNHPLLTWDSNIEPDLSGYKVYKYITYEVGWQYLTTTASPTYEDPTESYCPQGQYCESGHNVSYKVTVRDYSSKESVPSDSKTTYVLGGAPDKIVINPPIQSTPTEYILSVNYPNPFNPSTVINYAVQEAGLVKIKVYDILGNEVASLVNEMKEAGYHSVEFNASNLPSGVYIYTLQVNGFSASQKMLFLK